MSTPVSTVEIGGRLASLAIEEWLSGRLVDGNQIVERKCMLGAHELIVVPTQSWSVVSETLDDEPHGEQTISSMCRYCRYHFFFRITTPLNPTVHLMHHFVCQYAHNVEPTLRYHDPASTDRYKPVEGTAHFQCSECPVKVEIDVSVPRLKMEWVEILCDEARARTALDKAKAEDPERFLKSTPERDESLIKGGAKNLNQYLNDILSKKDPSLEARPRRISFRNKNYMVQFGEALEPLFEYLGFKKSHDEATNEDFWLTPRLDAADGNTEFGSKRAFYEDAKSEVQSLLEHLNPSSDDPVVKPLASARDRLRESLLSVEALSLSGSSVSEEELKALHALGASTHLVASHHIADKYIKYAYTMQLKADPEKKKKNLFCEALRCLSKLGSDELQVFALGEAHRLTEEDSGVWMSSRARLYNHYGLQINSQVEDSHIIGLYHESRSERPWHNHDHRKALLRIGRDRNNQSIITEALETPMDIDEAYELLEISRERRDAAMGNIKAEAIVLLNESRLDGELALRALRVILKNRPQEDPGILDDFEQRIQDSRNDILELSEAISKNRPNRPQPQYDPTLPAGLNNLRNTCYLNSILQYLYSVEAVRNLVLGLKRDPLEESEQKLQALLNNYPSSELDTGAAWVGHFFARELRTLFQDLQSSTDAAVTPRQCLANAALLTSEQMREAPAVPKTPAPPSRAPPLPPRAEESTDPKVSTELAPEPSETASDVSSQTLVNQSDDEPSYVVVDRDMVQSEAPSEKAPDPTVRKSNLTVEQLVDKVKNSAVVGTEQNDVDEVMGKVLSHLSVAFKVEQLGQPGTVRDPIEEAFFSTFIDHQKKEGDSTWSTSTRSDRWATAFPAIRSEEGRDIYEALGNSFNLEALGGGILRYVTIGRPAPNFQILIQRGLPGGGKNLNPIEIPEKLYLDRFMESRHSDPDMREAKKRAADLDIRISELYKDRTQSSNPQPKRKDHKPVEPEPEDIDEFISGDYGDQCPDGGWSILTPPLKEMFESYQIDLNYAEDTAENSAEAGSDPAVEKSGSEIDAFWREFSTVEKADEEDLRKERAKIFDNVKQEVEYRLHAVVCHLGAGQASGHYWVWIHDFEQDVWRKYNDSTVTVHQSDEVLREISTNKGQIVPYYLAYVRAQDISKLVNIPRRQAPSETPIDPALEDQPLESFPPFKDTRMDDPLETPIDPALRDQPLEPFPPFKDTRMPDPYNRPTTEHFELAPKSEHQR